ncbi:alpha/beta fold hydrolase [Clostridium arbusti]|uniref:alpha/beta fold hydrolase n=1 Tax=Clostridium arbusti TaxID=1137848 RepID=UPI0002891AE3|nr:alpha/beta hydrolase [Clostridium arbusti]
MSVNALRKVENTVNEKVFFFKDNDKNNIYTKVWYPRKRHKVKGIIQVAHGLGETIEYYEEFADFFIQNGYIVYVNEALGHGRTAGDINDLSYKYTGGNTGTDGLNHMVNNLKMLTDDIKRKYFNKKIFLIGHSLGSVLSQIYAYKYGDSINGIIFTGAISDLGEEKFGNLIRIAKNEVETYGRSEPSLEAFNAIFGHLNDKFEPASTEFDWITSDEKMLKESLSSPYANIQFNTGFYLDFFYALKDRIDKNNLRKIPKDLPLFFLSGSDDPFGNGIKELFNIYREERLKDISFNLYEGKRHSILREVNRSVVFKDILNWINKH